MPGVHDVSAVEARTDRFDGIDVRGGDRVRILAVRPRGSRTGMLTCSAPFRSSSEHLALTGSAPRRSASRKIRTGENRAVQSGANEIRFDKMCVGEIRPAQIGVHQIRRVQRRAPQTHAGEVHAGENHPVERRAIEGDGQVGIL